MFKVILVCAAVFMSLGSSGLAPFITPCKWNDSNCIKESAQKVIPIFADGVPELNVNQLDPMKIDTIDASSQNLKLILTDALYTGLKGAVATKILRDIEKSKLFITVEHNGVLKSKYDMNGKLFVLPIEGKGDLTVQLQKVVTDIEVDLPEKVGKDGKKYWSVKSWKYTYEVRGKCDIEFNNLFPNNEFLRKTTTEFIANNGNDIVVEIGQPIVQIITKKVVEDIKNLFKKVPVEELALD